MLNHDLLNWQQLPARAFTWMGTMGTSWPSDPPRGTQSDRCRGRRGHMHVAPQQLHRHRQHRPLSGPGTWTRFWTHSVVAPCANRYRAVHAEAKLCRCRGTLRHQEGFSARAHRELQNRCSTAELTRHAPPLLAPSAESVYWRRHRRVVLCPRSWIAPRRCAARLCPSCNGRPPREETPARAL
jgi:hypothetical protein